MAAVSIYAVYGVVAQQAHDNRLDLVAHSLPQSSGSEHGEHHGEHDKVRAGARVGARVGGASATARPPGATTWEGRRMLHAARRWGQRRTQSHEGRSRTPPPPPPIQTLAFTLTRHAQEVAKAAKLSGVATKGGRADEPLDASESPSDVPRKA